MADSTRICIQRFAAANCGLSQFLVTAVATIAAFYCASIGVADERSEFFERKIRPVFAKYCYECHSTAAKDPKGKLLLDSRENVLKGGESGPAVVPGKPNESLLIAAVRHESLEMPPGKRLPDESIADLAQWISSGAYDPRDKPADPTAVASETWEAQFEIRRHWWSLQPFTEPVSPSVQNAQWSSTPIDRFILAKLESNNLHPANRADRIALVRRLSFALTGLPPSAETTHQYLDDESPAAWEALVDQLLASPHFGEQWARHWMDVVRYTDTYGYEWDIPAKGAWRYRDYLTRAFNEDVPFDQLVREQLAGDLLEQPRIDRDRQVNESKIGLMFYQMGEKRHGDSSEFNGIHQEMLDNKIDAFGKSFMATTLACSRCHDHKLDAVSQHEYYALGGVFMSSRWVTNTVDLPSKHEPLFDELRQIKAELRQQMAEIWRADLQQMASDIRSGSSAQANSDESSRAAIWRKLLETKHDPNAPLENPLFPLLSISATTKTGSPVADEWPRLSQKYAAEGESRIQKNKTGFIEVADFQKEMPAEWSVDGVGFRSPTASGDLLVSLSGDHAVNRLTLGGLVSHTFSPRMNGAIRSPYLRQFDKAYISFEYCGGDFAAARTVVDNAFLTEKQQYLKQPSYAWLTLPVQAAMKNRRVYVELATKTSNPNFPPRVGLGGECSEEQVADPKSWFGVRRAVLHDQPAPPADELRRFARLFSSGPAATADDVAQRYQDWFAAALGAWSRSGLGETAESPEPSEIDDAVVLLNWLLDQGLLSNSREISSHPKVAELVDRYRTIESRLPEPETVNGMLDADPGYNYPLNIRGDYDQLGQEVPRGFLRVLLGSNSQFDSSGSGRLQLAKAIADPQNPLTARVFVNRVWHWLFGAGIVSTPDDFGHVGDVPSHPELLDFLAVRFVEQQWSLKRLVREIVLSETWQQSQATDNAALNVDPSNRLLHHYPLRRLEAENIRDAILLASGRLDTRLYGPPINPNRPNEDPQKRLFSGPVDGNGRRSIYTKITIMEPPRLMAIFNQPTPKIPTGKRDITTSATQSLTLLNDPFVVQQAEVFASSAMQSGAGSADERLSKMFETTTSRPPDADELQAWQQAVNDLAVLHQIPAERIAESLPIWKDIAHAMLNLKEFLYLR